MNTDNSKIATIIIAAALIAAFFMPWITIFINISAWDVVFGNLGEYVDSPARYLAVIIPLSSAIIVYSAAFNDQRYPIPKSFLFALPLITLVIIAAVIIIKINDNGGFRNDSGSFSPDIFKIFDIGFWITLIGSVVLTIIGVNTPAITLVVQPVAAPQPVAASNPTDEISSEANVPVIVSTLAEPQPADPPNSHSVPNSQRANFLLIASSLIFIGFFMPWLSINSESGVFLPTINGTYLISQANESRDMNFLLVIILLTMPVCSAVIAYNAFQKNISEKRLTIFISIATFIPLFILTLYFLAYNVAAEQLGVIKEGASLGAGAIMMIIGSLYLLYYVIKQLIPENKLLKTKSLLRYSLIGGITPLALYFLVLKLNIWHSGSNMIFLLPCILNLLSIIITNYLHKNSLGGQTNYSRIITLGCLVSVVFAFSFYLVCIIIYSKQDYEMRLASNIAGVLIISFTQIGFILSAIAGVWIDTNTAVQYITTNDGSKIIKEFPPVNTFNFGKFVSKYKWGLISITAAIFLGGILWYFLKPDPEKIGISVAKIECDCTEKFTDQKIKAYEQFISSFDSQNFKRRSEAKIKLDQLLIDAKTSDSSCLIAANAKKIELRNKFADNYNAMGIFDNAYNAQYLAFHATNEAKQNALLAQANQKIGSITDPEPDTNTMKLDLINKNIPGWVFNAASDIKQMQILNATRLPNRIEYLVDFKLFNMSYGNTVHDAQILLIYSYDGNEWIQVGVTESFITYDYVIPADVYITISTIPNCNWTLSSNVSNLSWKICNDSFNEYKSGPQLPKLTVPSSLCYNLKSLDGVPVTITFIYKPMN